MLFVYCLAIHIFNLPTPEIDSNLCYYWVYVTGFGQCLLRNSIKQHRQRNAED